MRTKIGAFREKKIIKKLNAKFWSRLSQSGLGFQIDRDAALDDKQ